MTSKTIAHLTAADHDIWSNNASFVRNYTEDRMAHVIEGFVRADGAVDVSADLLSAMGIGYRGGAHHVTAFARKIGFRVTTNKALTRFRFFSPMAGEG